MSLDSKLLWHEGFEGAIKRAEETVTSLGGTVYDVRISRCDICVDVLVPGGLTAEFLETLRVPDHRSQRSFKTSDRLETYYNGAKGADIQLRIYHKSLELWNALLQKRWFWQLWGTESDDVWRIEFQVRRAALNEFNIDDVNDLKAKLPGLWQYLTEDWFSLRMLDNENTSRRTIHPFWKDVQDCAQRFGEVVTVQRERVQGTADAGWYVSHIGGCLSGYAACKGLTDFDACVAELVKELKNHPKHDCFEDQVHFKRIQKGAK